MRLLLRGLLRLYRFSVAHEVTTGEELLALPSLPLPTVLVVDAGSLAPSWPSELSSALRARTELRALVILPQDGASLGPRAREAGASSVIVRPFTSQDFVRAVHDAVEAGSVRSGAGPA